MPLINSQKKRYSYTSHDCRETHFFKKNLNKTINFNTNFSNSTFTDCGLISTKFKYCSLFNCTFTGCYIRSALFRKCNLNHVKFIDCIITSPEFDKSHIEKISFINCKILTNNKNLKIDHKKNEIFHSFPSTNDFNNQLILEVEKLRNHIKIRQSTILHRKRKKLDTISIKMLQDIFGEQFLIKNMEKLAYSIKNDFYSLSYIVNQLNNIKKNEIIKQPGSIALNIPPN